jgi:hypothetical protein
LVFAFFALGDGVGDASVARHLPDGLGDASSSCAQRYAPVNAPIEKMIAMQMRKRGTAERNRDQTAFNSRKLSELSGLRYG